MVPVFQMAQLMHRDVFDQPQGVLTRCVQGDHALDATAAPLTLQSDAAICIKTLTRANRASPLEPP